MAFYPLKAALPAKGKLNFVFPVSIWLIWVVEIPIRSANSSCDNWWALRNFLILWPIS